MSGTLETGGQRGQAPRLNNGFTRHSVIMRRDSLYVPAERSRGSPSSENVAVMFPGRKLAHHVTRRRVMLIGSFLY